MEYVEIQWIKKRGGNLNPHERIERVGGTHGGKQWNLSEDDAIAGIRKGQWSFYVNHGGRAIGVKIDRHNGREYLKTIADQYLWDNLLALPNLAA